MLYQRSRLLAAPARDPNYSLYSRSKQLTVLEIRTTCPYRALPEIQTTRCTRYPDYSLYPRSEILAEIQTTHCTMQQLATDFLEDSYLCELRDVAVRGFALSVTLRERCAATLPLCCPPPELRSCAVLCCHMTYHCAVLGQS